MNRYKIQFVPQINNEKTKNLLDNRFVNDFNISQRLFVVFNDKTKAFERKMILSSKLKHSNTYLETMGIEYNFVTNEIKTTCKYCKRSDSKKICHHIENLAYAFNSKSIKNIICDDDELDNEYLRLIDDNNQEYIEKQKKEVSETVRKFRKFIQNSDSLYLKEKINLMPVIEITPKDVVSFEIKLSLKIGLSKYYLIKNIKDFIDRVKYKIEHNYSKNFGFNHNINNFNYESAQLINELNDVVNSNEYSSGQREINISEFFVEKILSIYKNKNVELLINNEEISAYVSDESYKCNLKLEKNKIKSVDGKNIIIIPGFNNDYVLDYNVIKKVQSDNEERELLRFVSNNPSFSFKYAEEEFTKDIYSRYSEYLDVEYDFKEKHKLSDVDIEVYFDMTNDKICYDTKYFLRKNEEKVEISEMSANDEYRNNKIIKYNNFIDNLGFNGKEISDINNIGAFLITDFSKFNKIATIYLSEQIKKMQVKKVTKSSTSLGYDTGMLSICFDKLNFSNEELSKILAGIKKKVKYVKLNKDTIVDVDTIDAKELYETVEEFKLDTKHLADKQVVPLYQSLKLLADNKVDYKVDTVLKEILYDIANYKTSDFKVPNELSNVMRDYQVDAYKWMKTLVKYNFCGILADDMGLGKTLEIISLIESDSVNKPSLIVCPKSLSYNWKNEFKKWETKINAVLINGNSIERKNIINRIKSNEKSVFITNYDSLKNDLEYYQNISFRYMILDEAQYIKNHNTLKAQSVKQINSELRFVLTGTPIENTVMDLWSIFDFLMPNYLYNYNAFKAQYEREITVNSNNAVIKNLVKKITPFILRRTKDEVLKDLPEKIEIIQYAEMNDDQRKIYEAELYKTKDIITKKASKIELLAQLTRLRQLCVDPKLYIDDFTGNSAKIDLAINLICDYVNEGHKILLFSQFSSIFPIISEKLNKEKIKHFEITGKTDSFDRVQMAQQFNSDESEEKVFLVSLKAGGTGLNLVGADIVIHLDPWWNVSAENQATDRAHRIGQKNIVKVVKLVCENSIEQKVIELQEAKKHVINSVIANNDKNIVKLSDDDLYYLLS